MKKKLSRKEVQENIDKFFVQKKGFDPKYVRKIKRLAMNYNVKLGKYRRLFCKKCFSDIRNAKSRVNKGYKNVECGACGEKSRWKIN